MWFSDRKRTIFECGCICDLDVLGFVDLLNEESLEILKTYIECWITESWRISKNSASFSYEGSMSGIRSMLDIEYDFKCVLKKVRYIKLETARN